MTTQSNQEQWREPERINDRQDDPCTACSGGQPSQDKQNCPGDNTLRQAGNRNQVSQQGMRWLNCPAVPHRKHLSHAPCPALTFPWTPLARLCPVPGRVCPVQNPGAGELSDRRQRILAYKATCYHVRTELD
jgi:hypothetical protein